MNNSRTPHVVRADDKRSGPPTRLSLRRQARAS